MPHYAHIGPLRHQCHAVLDAQGGTLIVLTRLLPFRRGRFSLLPVKVSSLAIGVHAGYDNDEEAEVLLLVAAINAAKAQNHNNYNQF